VLSKVNHGSAVQRYWHDRLGDRSPFRPVRIESNSDKRTLRFFVDDRVFGVIKATPILGLPVTVNGTRIESAIVDTGSDLSTISRKAAKRLGLKVDSARVGAAGALDFEASASIVDELSIGGVTLADVPVTVGNMGPLTLGKAEMTIGVDLLHHLRFTISADRTTARVGHRSEPIEEMFAGALAHRPTDLKNLTDPSLRKSIKIEPIFLLDGAPYVSARSIDRRKTESSGSNDSSGRAEQAGGENNPYQAASIRRRGEFRLMVDTGKFGDSLVNPDWASRRLTETSKRRTGLLTSETIWTFDRIECVNHSADRLLAVEPSGGTFKSATDFDLLAGTDALFEGRAVLIDMTGRRFISIQTDVK
jgi:hypothetical protein